VQGEGGFSSPAFLADYGDCFHIAGIAANRIDGKNFCLDALLLAIQQILSPALAPRSLSKAHRTIAAGANVAVLLRGCRLPIRLIRGSEPPQGRESGPNSGDRLCLPS
jgi:hypothetical protein